MQKAGQVLRGLCQDILYNNLQYTTQLETTTDGIPYSKQDNRRWYKQGKMSALRAAAKEPWTDM